MQSIPELVRSSSLIFSGTVVAIGASTVSAVPARPDLVTVRVTRGLRVDPALGDLRGRMVTVRTSTARELRLAQSAIFFTLSWIHGDGVAVRELGRLEAAAEAETAAAVASLPEEHLNDRVRGAELIVHAEVTAVRAVANRRVSRHAPVWALAVLRVEHALKGAGQEISLLFPTSTSVEWREAPRFTQGQRGVFMMHRGDPPVMRWIDEKAIGTTPLTALDPADFQPVSELDHISRLLAASGSPGDIR